MKWIVIYLDKEIIFILSRAENVQNRNFWKQLTVIKVVKETLAI